LPRDENDDFPAFVPRAPWWGGDLQTLRNYVRRQPDLLVGFPGERLELPLGDGSGDRLVATLHRPAGASERPLMILIHGLTGTEASSYIRASAAAALAAGFPVLRLNLRGAGPSRPLCRLQYHAGRTEDFADALAALPETMTRNGIVAIGFSLGANLLLKFLGEGGDKRLRGAVAVSAPLDLAAAARRLMARRNAFYHRIILAHMKEESLAPIAALTDDERKTIAEAPDVIAFDDRFVAPRNGFAGAADYYARCSAGRYLDAIATPSLVIHALDDPWIPAASYLAREWRVNPHVTALLPPRGGHVGFHGKGGAPAWHDRCALRFLAAI
jgi:predicted alpha/beta-fold hydrolase